VPLLFRSVTPTAAEVEASRPGDHLVPDADVVMDRAFTLPAPADAVWPWVVQLGKQRAGWYLTRRAERAVPASRRAARRIDPRWQGLTVGDVVPVRHPWIADTLGGAFDALTIAGMAAGLSERLQES
jgi:hypothetical protein